jgi:hypothetical protein
MSGRLRYVDASFKRMNDLHKLTIFQHPSHLQQNYKSYNNKLRKLKDGNPTAICEAGPITTGEDDEENRDVTPSNEIEVTGEVAATPSTKGAGQLTFAAAIKSAKHKLNLELKNEDPSGNCMFCAFASGLNSWLDGGQHATPGWCKYVMPVSNEGKYSSALHVKVTGSNSAAITWKQLRAALVKSLHQTVDDANVSDKNSVMVNFCEGEYGRAWLNEGDLKNASPRERFDAHLHVMAQDASRHADNNDRWTRYWGSDVEVTALAAALGVACVVIDESNGEGRYYLAVPAHVTEPIENTDGTDERKMRPGLYMLNGEWAPQSSKSAQLMFKPSNRGAKSISLCVREVEAGSEEANAASKGQWSEDDRYLPAIVLIHRPKHYDSLQPKKDKVLVLERESVDSW